MKNSLINVYISSLESLTHSHIYILNVAAVIAIVTPTNAAHGTKIISGLSEIAVIDK